MKNNNVGRYGVVLAVVLFLIFVALKLTGVITCSWWWISAPLWAPLVSAVILVILFFILANHYTNKNGIR
ncbi:hypothetical protein [Bacteroides sp. 41_26]|uniref:hypothetical protein n=1 Tax=Bacteroides sp. 41_26 TaxID=1896973 RepID=UPI00259D0AD9|nr:hypothetical protein [Bacteroides sp. 41_26]